MDALLVERNWKEKALLLYNKEKDASGEKYIFDCPAAVPEPKSRKILHGKGFGISTMRCFPLLTGKMPFGIIRM